MIAAEKERASLGATDDAQRFQLTRQLGKLNALFDGADNLSDEKIAANGEAKKQKEQADAAADAAAKKSEQDQKNQEANEKTAEAREEARKQHEEQLKNEHAVEMAKQAASRGEYSDAIPNRIKAMQKLASDNPRIDDLTADPKLVASRERINNFSESQQEQLGKSKDQVNMEAWKAQDQAADDLRQKQIDGLKEQDTLLEAQAKKRLAELEASNKNERAIAAERVRIEDEVAAKRLDLQNQIGSLQGESSLARETRQDLASAEQTTRDHAAAKQSGPQATYENSTVERDLGGNITKFIPIPKKGESMDTDVTQRPGYHEQPSVDRLAAYAARQAPGAMRHPWETLPLPGPASRPGSALAGSASGAGAASGNDPAKAVQDTAGKIVSETQKQAAVITTSMGKILAAMQAETKRFEQLAAQVERIKRT
jgi:hypothetical protein